MWYGRVCHGGILPPVWILKEDESCEVTMETVELGLAH
jgi:hypothetical protein